MNRERKPKMDNPRYKLSELAELAGAGLDGRSDPLISGAAGFDAAGPNQITFVDDKRLAGRLGECRAGAVVLRPDIEFDGPALRAEEPRLVFARILELFAMSPDRLFPPGIHPSAVIDPEADIGEAVRIGPACVIGADARIGDRVRLGAGVVVEPEAVIGDNTELHNRVIVGHRCRIGRDCILYAGAVIGSDGFGYHPGSDGLQRIPQIGIVVIEDRVDVGANACIDRATTGETRIAAGTKIDNLVQIGHNVAIGRHCAISAQTGISGSSILGDGLVLGGQVGVADHLKLGDGVKIAAQSGITRDIPENTTVFGCPAVEFNKAFRIVAHTHRLPEMAKRLERLERAAARNSDAKD